MPKVKEVNFFRASEFQKFRCGIRGCAGERICFPPRGDRIDVTSARQRGVSPYGSIPVRGYLSRGFKRSIATMWNITVRKTWKKN